jgi:two-component system sensor histidine kinase KdpD
LTPASGQDDEVDPKRRGTLRVYLGYAPGVGKTYAMVDEGRRRADRGATVVASYVDNVARSGIANLLTGLERVPLEVASLVRRRPDVVLVDDIGGDRRWTKLDQLLEAGIDVVATVDVSNLESLSDVVASITGRGPGATVPDSWLTREAQVELVDMTPEALQRRLAHGNVYPSEQLDAATAASFRTEVLAARRSLALRWLTDHVASGPEADTRERVMVAVTAAPGNEAVIRRAARLADRLGGELVAVHVRAKHSQPDALLAPRRQLVDDLGGDFVEITADDVPTALVEVARAERATQLVVGATRRSWVQEHTGGSVVNQVVRRAREVDVDVHVIASDEPADRVARPTGSGPLRQRRGWLTLAIGLPLTIGALTAVREDLGVPASLLLMLCLTVVVAAVGGIVAGVCAAVLGVLAANWFLVPPYHAFTVAGAQDEVALVVFVVAGVAAATAVEMLARRSAEVARAEAGTAALARSAAAVASAPDPLPALLEETSTALGARSAAVEELDANGRWRTRAQRGPTLLAANPSGGDRPPPEGSIRRALNDAGSVVLVVEGYRPDPGGHALLDALVDELTVAVGSAELQRAAERAEVLDRVQGVRTGILQAVSHDLRTPLTAIKASVTSLLSSDITFDEADTQTFLETIDSEVDRLDRVVGNLLDMSRLQSGSLGVRRSPSPLEEIVGPAVEEAVAGLSQPRAPDRVSIRVSETLPLVDVDAALTERAIANLVANALDVQPPDRPVVVQADQVGDEVVLQIVDHGPGIARSQRAAVLEPFHRLGDRSSRAGVGLGLAIANGFVEATAGRLELGDTPGGGLTITVSLPIASEARP